MIADGVTRVDVAPLREAFGASGLTAHEVARRLGWMRDPSPAMVRNYAHGPRPDNTRVRAALGLKRNLKAGRASYRQSLPYEQAAAIARALDVDPMDVGL